jgi:hypothetical protein
VSDEEEGRLGYFAIMWDCYGLEAVEAVPDPAETTFALLKGVEPPRPPNILHWRLRAQANSHRFYEIYIISCRSGINSDDIREIFNADPQTAADLVRRTGHKYYSDRVQEDRIVIR